MYISFSEVFVIQKAACMIFDVTAVTVSQANVIMERRAMPQTTPIAKWHASHGIE